MSFSQTKIKELFIKSGLAQIMLDFAKNKMSYMKLAFTLENSEFNVKKENGLIIAIIKLPVGNIEFDFASLKECGASQQQLSVIEKIAKDK